MSNSSVPEPPGGSSSLSVLLARVMWALMLPMVLVLAAFRIVALGNGWLTRWDVTFWVVVALMLGCRAIEQRSGEAYTMMGTPSTWRHFRRYALGLLPAAGLVWVIANILGNYVLA